MTLRVELVRSLVTIQDDGRVGRAHQGVARSGAFDQRARALANRVVGNPSTAAVLEALLGSCRFRATQPVIVTVTGARVPLTVNREAAGQDMAIFLRPDDVLDIGMCTEGLRAYLSIAGGVDGRSVLGSRSFDSLGRIGPPPLQAGDVIHCADLLPAGEPWFEPIPTRPFAAEPDIEIVLGPRHDWLAEDSSARLTTSTWTVSAVSDRTGVRLTGPMLQRTVERATDELPSEAMIPGAVQVPPNGQPIILGPDCGTTGGYPVVAVVRPRSQDDVAQLRPGQRLHFVLRR